MRKFLKNSLAVGFFIGLLCLGAGSGLRAQNTAFYDQPEAMFRDAFELYAKAKYASARKQFMRVSQKMAGRTAPEDDFYRSESDFYAAVSGARLYHRNAQVDLQRFIETYPMSNHIQQAWREMGDYLYHYKQYAEAYEAYSHVSVDDLTPEELEAFRFHVGYAAFSGKRYDEAKLNFAPLIESTGKYRIVAGYYYAYILYMEGKYQNALNEFAKIQDDPTFKTLVPFYVQQIYYMQGRYKDVVDMAETLMASASSKRQPEVARLVGESYYQLGDYDRALPYMQFYFDRSAQRPDKDGDYILGYIYYKRQVYDTASHYFLRVLSVDKDSELAQSAYYHLAYCYVQRGQKKFAMDAFRDASRLKFNPVVQEDAMYHYAQLSYELGLAPYKESVTVFTDFLEAYPQSAYSRKIYEYMLSAYSRNRHYAEALAAIEKLQPLSYELKQAKQNLLFNRGMEAFRSRKYPLADTSFVTAAQVLPDEALAARAMFWAGESAWQLDEADTALTRYEAFAARPEAVSTPEYAMVYYNLGYLYMDRVRYEQALSQWERFFAVCRAADTAYLTDAYLRAGDCEFMLRHFDKAEAYYTKVIDKGREPLDYALYQRALCEGAQGRYQEKVDGLLGLIENYPRTAYMSMAINELAATYLVLEQNDKALMYYRQLYEGYPRQALARVALLKIGMIYFNMGESARALENFKRLNAEYPASTEARQALVNIRNIYMMMNRVDEFFTYVKQLPYAVKIEEGEKDSITYLALENRYMEGDCEAAVKGFEQYLQDFPQGYFITPAWFYLGECAYRQGQDSVAETAYAKVAQLPACEFTEKAVQRAAALSYARGDYATALRFYKQMVALQNPSLENEALMGRLRCFYRLGQDKNTEEAAISYLRREGMAAADRQEAMLYAARVAVKKGDAALANRMYNDLLNAADPNIQAEARYYMIERRVKEGDYNMAEQLIFDYIADAPAEEYYLAKVYMLWADIYEHKGNVLQAKQTLQSIIDHYEGDDLVTVARQKYAAIEAVEQAERELEERERAERYRYAEEEEIVIPEM